MAKPRSKARAPKRTAAPRTKMAWENSHRELFQLAADDWTPPKEIAVRHGARSWTLTAVFITPNGTRATVTAQLIKTASAVVRGDQSMKLFATLGGRP